jgi:hypothetical protein
MFAARAKKGGENGARIERASVGVSGLNARNIGLGDQTKSLKFRTGKRGFAWHRQ